MFPSQPLSFISCEVGLILFNRKLLHLVVDLLVEEKDFWMGDTSSLILLKHRRWERLAASQGEESSEKNKAHESRFSAYKE